MHDINIFVVSIECPKFFQLLKNFKVNLILQIDENPCVSPASNTVPENRSVSST